MICKKNNLSYYMNKIILESLIIGVITLIIGNLVTNLLFKFKDVDDNESLDSTLVKYSNSYIFHIILFLTGVILHLLLEYVGLENWYCEKVCMKDKCNMVCVKPVGNEGLFGKYNLTF